MKKCRCDEYDHPPKLRIPAGLTDIPRQIAGYGEFRRAMLAAMREHEALRGWRARGDGDLGIMLLEMWAYVADVLAFYDEVIAHELYLRTARQRPSLRKLVDLLGYVPRPAVSATATLAVLAEGRQPVLLPEGLAFRSSAFDDQAPQVFELDAATTVHPLNNRWTLAPPTQETLVATAGAGAGTFAGLPFSRSTALKADHLALVRVGSTDAKNQVSVIQGVSEAEGEDGKAYKQVSFAPTLSLGSGVKPGDVRVSRATQTGGLWTHAQVSPDPASIDGSKIVLDGLYRQIKAGGYVILSRSAKYRWFKVTANNEKMMTLSAATTTTAKDSEGNDVTVAVPPIKAAATRLVLDVPVNASGRKTSGDTADWTSSNAGQITLHYALAPGGEVIGLPKSSVSSADDLIVSGRIEQPAGGTSPGTFLLRDKDDRGLQVEAAIDYGTGELTLEVGEGWTAALTSPVTVYGNVVTASRGETVTGEVLGSGDASVANQFFVLKKSPLTYLPSPAADNEQGVASSLVVYVDGILWREVPSFYGAGPEDPVYIVRQNDDGGSIVTFGDGRRGARLPSGTDNVVATYRHGAGRAAPPAGAITQLARPVKGLTGVQSPVAAKEGADAESAEDLRDLAPRSALLLNRAVSIQDMQAAAARVPGVRGSSAEWRWNQAKQRPVVQVWYIGSYAIAEDVEQAIRRLVDPTTPLAVKVASPLPLWLMIHVEIDERVRKEDVLSQVRSALMDAKTGLLAPERIGIGKPIYRSQVFRAVTAVEGVVSVPSIRLGALWADWPWVTFGYGAPPGTYFSFERGGLLLNGKGSDNG